MNRFDKNTEEYKLLKHFSRFLYMDRSRTRQHDVIDSIASRLDNFIIEAFIYDIKELTDIAKTIRHWKPEIINSFNHHGRRISNGPIESVNARIKSINRNGNGYQNFERFRLRVPYSLNDNSEIKGFDG